MGFPKLLVVAIPIGLWRWSAQVMLPAAFSALWTCREPLELLPLGDLILEWFHGKMTGTEATTGTEPQILKTTWKSSVLHPKHFWPHVWEHIGCNSPFHECTKTKINPHGIAFTSSKIRQFLLSWINQLVFSPCFPMFFPCFVISSGEVNGFIFSHFIQLDLLQAGEKSLASVLRRIHHVEPLIWVCLKIVGAPKPNGFADHYPY